VLSSPIGFGKSNIVRHLSYSVANGLPFPGCRTHKSRVVFVNGELKSDSVDELNAKTPEGSELVVFDFPATVINAGWGTLDASAPTARLLRKFAERVINGELQDGTTLGALGRFGWSGVSPENALELCEALESLNWLELQHHRPAGRRGGRPSFKIYVNPAVVGNKALLVDEPLASTGPELPK
jgi:hypothetical protein